MGRFSGNGCVGWCDSSLATWSSAVLPVLISNCCLAHDNDDDDDDEPMTMATIEGLYRSLQDHRVRIRENIKFARVSPPRIKLKINIKV